MGICSVVTAKSQNKRALKKVLVEFEVELWLHVGMFGANTVSIYALYIFSTVLLPI